MENRLIELLLKEVRAAWLSEGCEFAVKDEESEELNELIKKWEESLK